MAESTRAVGALALDRGLERQRVHHRRQHAHIVGARPVHAAFRRHQAAIDVAGADHEANLGAGGDGRGNVAGDGSEHVKIDAVAFVAGERLARQLHQHSPIAKVLGGGLPCHQPSSRLR